MDTQRIWRPLCFGILAAGICISFVVAVLPFYETGHHLAFGLFVVGIVPYVLYGTLHPYLPGVRCGVTGGLVLLIDLVTRLPKRFAEDPVSATPTYRIVPLVLTAVVFAITWFIGRRPDEAEAPVLGAHHRGDTGNPQPGGP